MGLGPVWLFRLLGPGLFQLLRPEDLVSKASGTLGPCPFLLVGLGTWSLPSFGTLSLQASGTRDLIGSLAINPLEVAISHPYFMRSGGVQGFTAHYMYVYTDVNKTENLTGLLKGVAYLV